MQSAAQILARSNISPAACSCVAVAYSAVAERCLGSSDLSDWLAGYCCWVCDSSAAIEKISAQPSICSTLCNFYLAFLLVVGLSKCRVERVVHTPPRRHINLLSVLNTLAKPGSKRQNTRRCLHCIDCHQYQCGLNNYFGVFSFHSA